MSKNLCGFFSLYCYFFFFFKQKTAYEIKECDWSFRRVLFQSSSILWSLPRILLCLRTPKIWAILSAVRPNNPNSQERSKILWMGKLRRNRKFRQYSTWFSEYSRRRGMAARSFFENFGPRTRVQ